MIGFVLAGYIIVSADVAHLSVLIHKAVVLLFAILSSTTFMDSNPHKCREESSVIKKKGRKHGGITGRRVRAHKETPQKRLITVVLKAHSMCIK